MASLLEARKEEIVHQWAHRLHEEVSDRYRQRPIEELFMTTSEATEANFSVLTEGDFTKIDLFIEKITQLRLQAGFPLSDVQKAFELYRTILTPILVKELEGEELLEALQKLNYCLSYTITRFSDYFQSEHERQIREHAETLEEEVRRRTKELAESEAKYRVLVEDINDGYFVVQKGKIAFANRAFCEMHGWPPQEVIGRPWSDFVAPESLEEVRRIYEGRGRKRDLFVYFRRHRDGRSLPTENKVKIITYQGRRAAAGICRDITERVEMEKRVREAERLAHIGQLTTSLAHEIRNPLSSVKMNIQILLKKLDLDGNDKRRMEIMAQEITRLERILKEMLDFARPVPLRLRPASVNEVVKRSLEVLEAKIKQKGLKVRRRLSKTIPKVLIDPDRLEQALINVLLNAIEVLPAGGRIEVSTRQASEDGRMIEAKVEDNGPGVAPEDLPYIFDPFFSKKKGTGIGLTNVKKIVEAHGGRVKASLRTPHGMSLSLLVPSRR